MKLKPFKELIAMSKEKLDEAMAPIRARQVKSQAELELAKLDAEILTHEGQVQEMCTQKEINFPNLLDKLDKIALLERRKNQYANVLKQLFPA
ncbi:hypothetical protein D9M72_530720 [compost metagenome]